MKVRAVIVVDRADGVMCLVGSKYLRAVCCFLLLAMHCWALLVLLLSLLWPEYQLVSVCLYDDRQIGPSHMQMAIDGHCLGMRQMLTVKSVISLCALASPGRGRELVGVCDECVMCGEGGVK